MSGAIFLLPHTPLGVPRDSLTLSCFSLRCLSLIYYYLQRDRPICVFTLRILSPSVNMLIVPPPPNIFLVASLTFSHD
jgi:hypothetical protein